MSLVLGRKGANRESPNPRRVRDRNSPDNPAMEDHVSHAARCNPLSRRGQLAFRSACFPDRKVPLLRSRRRRTISGRRPMAERPVATGTEARAGTREGVVRYVLMVSLVLVVVLFVVAYELFS